MDNCLENSLAPPTYLTSELSRCCISTTSEKHTKQPAKKLVPTRQATTSSRELNCSRRNQPFCATFCDENYW